jgi:hypothetical protein
MAYLITHHDKFHIHKTLGLLAVLNFILRIYYAIRYRNSFPEWENKTFACASVLVHAALPVASLMLPLPTKRNFSSPMIWPEFRLHSILFSCRHVVVTLVSILGLWPTQVWGAAPGAVVAECALKLAVVLAVVQIAAIISHYYGDKEKRTTNAMPYPPGVSEDEQAKIKYEYAKKQFGATLMACFPGPFAAALNFAPLYAIQSAPFMMTLVRKGKCASIHYHCVYASTLVYPLYLYHVILRRGSTQMVDVAICFLYKMAFSLRLHSRWSNEAMWSLVVPLVVISWSYIPPLQGFIFPPGGNLSMLQDAICLSVWFVLMWREIVCDCHYYSPFARCLLKGPEALKSYAVDSDPVDLRHIPSSISSFTEKTQKKDVTVKGAPGNVSAQLG